MASGGDFQRSGLPPRRRNQYLSRFEQQLVLVEDTLEFESVCAPDILICVHRVDRDQQPVPFTHAI